MPKTSDFSRNVGLCRDAVNGTYAWIKRQGVSPMILSKIRVIANESLKLGMMMNAYEQDRFKDGLEYELLDE